MWLQRERKDDVIWSDLKLGGHLKLNAILFQSWSKLRSRSWLTSFIESNILRSSSHTTLWFLQVKHQHLKTNLQGFPSHLHILISSKSNLKLQVFGLFSCFVRTLIIKISSSEGPANTTSIHRVRNIGILVIFFHPSPKKYYKKVSIAKLKTRRSALKVSQWRRTRRTKFYWRMRSKMPLCLFPYQPSWHFSQWSPDKQ